MDALSAGAHRPPGTTVLSQGDMWVATSVRGLGLGTRILHYLEELARERRLPLLRLETNKALTEAQSLYRRNGFREVPAFNDEPYAHYWFEKVLGGR